MTSRPASGVPPLFAAALPSPIDAAGPETERLAVASRLSTKLAPLLDPAEITRLAVEELHHSFDYFLAVVQRLDPDGVLRVVSAAGPLARSRFLYTAQPIDVGVNGRVARTGRPALVNDTRLDPDYLRRDPRTDPGSELSLPVLVDGLVWGVLNLEQLSVDAFRHVDLLLAETVAAAVGAALHRIALHTELERAFTTTLGVLCDALETKDGYTAAHADEVADLAEAVGRRLGISGRPLRELRYSALLHDIGKIGIRSEILTKPGRLTPGEFEEIKQHTVIGSRMLARIPFFAPLHTVVRASHERVDGGGYPDGLAGDAIPLAARIVSACDAFHAMVSDRPYRRALSREDAIDELRRGAGTQFDAAVVSAILDEVSAADQAEWAASAADRPAQS